MKSATELASLHALALSSSLSAHRDHGFVLSSATLQTSIVVTRLRNLILLLSKTVFCRWGTRPVFNYSSVRVRLQAGRHFDMSAAGLQYRNSRHAIEKSHSVSLWLRSQSAKNGRDGKMRVRTPDRQLNLFPPLSIHTISASSVADMVEDTTLTPCAFSSVIAQRAQNKGDFKCASD